MASCYIAKHLRGTTPDGTTTLGRFAQADSIIPDEVQGLDRYAYVNNSPMNYVDPSGHTAMCGVSCEEEYEKSQHRNNGGTLSRNQIRQLLGFETDDELSSWINANENNNKFYMLLDYAQPGDIIRTQWNNNTNNLMITQHQEELAFYSIETRSLLEKDEIHGFTQGSGNSLKGAGILSHEEGNQYRETPYLFGQVDMEDYSLPYGWNRSSNGHGGVVLNPQLSTGDTVSLLGTVAPVGLYFIPGAIPIEYAYFAFSTTFTGVGAIINSDQIPTYYDYLPPQ